MLLSISSEITGPNTTQLTGEDPNKSISKQVGATSSNWYPEYILHNIPEDALLTSPFPATNNTMLTVFEVIF